MIHVKSPRDIVMMKDACRIAAEALRKAGELVEPGVSLSHIDSFIKRYIESCGATPSFLHYNGFPASACISINEEVIHGIPGERKIRQGDIVKIDVGAFYKGYHGDCADTFAAGGISDEAKRLIAVTRQSFFDGISYIKSLNRVGDISSAIQRTVEKNGFSVIRDYVGHGVGAKLHEEPDVPNYGVPGRGARLYSGMTIAIEPMVCAGDYRVRTLENDWTVVTCDGSLSAHYENTVLITDNGVEIMTAVD